MAMDIQSFITFLPAFMQMWQWLLQSFEEDRIRLNELNEDIRRSHHRRRVLLARAMQSKRNVTRSCWVYPELIQPNANFWEYTVPLYTDIRFQKKFRLSRLSFNNLVTKLTPYLLRDDTIMRRAIPVEKRVGISLYALKCNADMWTIADLFGVGKSTVSFVLHEFCAAVNTHLYGDSVKFPSSREERDKIAKDFFNRWQFPGCIGSLDGSHIPIIAPNFHPADYYNYKSYHSIVLLGLVDSNYRFIYANIGRPGRANDASIFADSGLNSYMNNNFDHIAENDHHIIGDAAFPLMPWLLTPYTSRLNMPLEEFNFNYRMSSARMSVEDSFGRLKGRWRILMKRADFSLKNMKEIVKTCVVLHNMCEENNDRYYPEWNEQLNERANQFPQPVHVHRQGNIRATAVAKRQMIAERLYNDGLSVQT